MEMATFVCSDIHGEYNAWMEAIEKSGMNLAAGDRFIILGDVIDRGKDSLKCLEYAFELMDKFPEQVTYLMGNHEEMFLNFVNSPEPKDHHEYSEMRYNGNLWVQNGGLAMLVSLLEHSVEAYYDLHELLNIELAEWIPRLNQLPLYSVDEEHNCVYVHAGFKSEVPLKKQTSKDMLWIRNDFFNGFKPVPGDELAGKLIVHGHTPVRYFSKWQGKGYYDGGFHVCIDGGSSDENGAIIMLKMDDMSYVSVPTQSKES